MQLMLLEQQNKKRLLMARQEQDFAKPVEFHDGIYKSETSNDDRRPANIGYQPSGLPSHALTDYQMQLMLLDQQKTKRLSMARQEQESFGGRAGEQK